MPLSPEQLAALRTLVVRGFDTAPKAWWFRDGVRDSESGWPEVFASANYHCVYCRKNLSTTLDDLASSTTDHLIPQRLFKNGTSKRFDQSPNWLSNLVPCCGVCNSLKGSWALEDPRDPAWTTRKSYIAAARAHIRTKREERRKVWEKHFDAAVVVIWNAAQHPDLVD